MFGAGIAYNINQRQRNNVEHRNVERLFRDRLDLLAISDTFLIRYYRFPRHVIVELCDILEPELARATIRSHALPVMTQVLLCLRFLASGSFQNVLGNVGGISQSSFSRVITKFCAAMVTIAPQYITYPLDDPAEMAEIKAGFYAIRQFPNVVGTIDATHVDIKAPSIDEPNYVNRHGRHSLNVQGICRADLLILNIVVRWPGSTHDSFIWRQSNIKHRLDNGVMTGWLLGDSGYPIEKHLLTPVRNPTPGAEERYNASHMATRSCVERCFGVLKSRFRALDKSGGCLMYQPERVRNIIVAACVLHNWCIARRIPLLEPLVPVPGDVDADVAALVGQQLAGVQIRQHLINTRFA